MNGYSFDDEARAALARAHDEAIRLHHEYIGTEHIVLGLIGDPSSVAARILVAANIAPDAVRTTMESVVHRGWHTTDRADLPFTSRAKTIFESAIAEATRHGASTLSSAHLLLGTLAEGKGIGAQVLSGTHGLTLTAARAYFLQLSGIEEPYTTAAFAGTIEGDVGTPARGRILAAILRKAAATPEFATIFARHRIDAVALARDVELIV
jgi:ATP-dependent Clp protease ATP-binding subunit ClpC